MGISACDTNLTVPGASTASEGSSASDDSGGSTVKYEENRKRLWDRGKSFIVSNVAGSVEGRLDSWAAERREHRRGRLDSMSFGTVRPVPPRGRAASN